jgi:hypothetical protein
MIVLCCLPYCICVQLHLLLLKGAKFKVTCEERENLMDREMMHIHTTLRCMRLYHEEDVMKQCRCVHTLNFVQSHVYLHAIKHTHVPVLKVDWSSLGASCTCTRFIQVLILFFSVHAPDFVKIQPIFFGFSLVSGMHGKRCDIALYCFSRLGSSESSTSSSLHKTMQKFCRQYLKPNSLARWWYYAQLVRWCILVASCVIHGQGLPARSMISCTRRLKQLRCFSGCMEGH